MKNFDLHFPAFHFTYGNEDFDDLPQWKVFILGYELGGVYMRCKNTREAFSQYIHTENIPYINDICKNLGRTFKIFWDKDDPNEEWAKLIVEEKNG